MIGIVRLAAEVSVNLCRLCPWLNPPTLVCVFGLKLIAAPKIPISAEPHNFSHPLLPPGITISKRGDVRGKVFDSEDTN